MCAAARASFDEWRAKPGEESKRILHRVAEVIVARADDVAMVESVDTGQAIRFMSSAALRGAEYFRFFADRASAASAPLKGSTSSAGSSTWPPTARSGA